jgi:hypothetical protein
VSRHIGAASFNMSNDIQGPRLKRGRGRPFRFLFTFERFLAAQLRLRQRHSRLEEQAREFAPRFIFAYVILHPISSLEMNQHPAPLGFPKPQLVPDG